MLVLTIVTVLQFGKLRYKMLVRPINLSPWYCVKDNVVLQALCPSSARNLNPRCYGLWKAMLDTHQNSQLRLRSSGFLSPNWLNSLMVLLNRLFFHLSMADNVIVLMLIWYVPLPTAFTISFPKLFVHVFNRESQWDTSLGFLRERFSKSIENNNHSRIIYRKAWFH